MIDISFVHSIHCKDESEKGLEENMNKEMIRPQITAYECMLLIFPRLCLFVQQA